MRKELGYVLIALLLALASSTLSSAKCAEPATPEVLSLTAYFDGFVLVDYELDVDSSYPAVNVTLFGQVLEDILVVDEKVLPLDYALVDGEITVYSLGAEQVTITYFTQDLTTKIGGNWTLEVDVPINATVILPADAKVVDVNVVPISIEGIDSQVILVMPAGLIEVTYVAERKISQPYLIYGLLAIILAMAFLGLLAYWFRMRPRLPKLKKVRRRIDFEKIHRQHKDLRLEDKQAVQFLVENNGEAFEAQLYEKLKLPRTSTWRMIRRLQRMGIVDIKKFRRQNLICIKKRYELKK